MPAQITLTSFFKKFSARMGEGGDWASSNAELAHLLNAFSEFHYCHTYGPDKGFFQPYILELLTAHMGAVVDWYMPTAEELEAEAEFRATGIQRIY